MNIFNSRYVLERVAKNTAVHIFLMAAAAACLLPLFWMIRSSLMSNATIFTDQALFPHEFNAGNYATAWVRGNFSVYFLNSVLYTVSVVAGIVMIASLAAFAFSRLRFPGRDVLFYMFVAAMMIPLPGSFVPLFVMMSKLHLTNSPLGYILCMINVGLPLSILLLKTFFDKMPQDLEDAARIDGCSRVQILWHVALPLARPAIAVIVMYNTLNVWNEFILANLLLNDKSLMPLQTGLMAFAGTHQVDYPVLMAGLTITAIPVVAVYVFMQKHIVKELWTGVLVG
ncbi:MAG: carbohydrate ABC transporter permease [Candidatus Omnitrophica bacterium]|nr:carbohydrate ABC transporter permease [Candidatus Omnitrophota bacterium]